MGEDRYQLQRFVWAQEPLYGTVCRELAAGTKRSHWMWFIFPQLAGLGRSTTAAHYAINSVAEARAYLAHPVLGARLRECTALLLALDGRSAREIFGYPDVLKLHSSLTLFHHVDAADPLFTRALEKYYAGEPDGATLRLLANLPPAD